VKALKSVWKDHRQRNGLKEEEPADNLLTSIELVLDNHNQLVEMNRLPGENEVCSCSLLMHHLIAFSHKLHRIK